MTPTDLEFVVWWNGDAWAVSVDGRLVAFGETPTTAIINAEAAVLRDGSIPEIR